MEEIVCRSTTLILIEPVTASALIADITKDDLRWPHWSTLQNLAKVGFTAGEILCLHFPAVGPQLDSLNQPGVHHGKLI
jgi:hypothetical protein